jgi:hypothetical protein
MDRKVFFDKLGPHVNLTTQNVSGMGRVLSYGEEQKTPLTWLAYIIATAWWETNQTMWPIKEAYWLSEGWRKRNLRYYPYYGRGLVQVTWKANSKKLGEMIGVGDLFVTDPDKMLEWQYALPALFVGMRRGIYTGKALGDYVDEINDPGPEIAEYIAARIVVNGTDKARTIANLAARFEAALEAADYVGMAPPKDVDLESLPTLTIGTRGLAVAHAQKLLSLADYAVTPDGVYGRKTAAAVESFQRRNLGKTQAAEKTQGCAIKGNISRGNERIYHMPFQQFYSRTKIDEGKGERWFCTEQEALDAGWRRSLR